MDPHDMTKSQVILKMLCCIYENPFLTPHDLQKKLGIKRDKYFRYFSELSQITALSYCRKTKSFKLNPPFALKEMLGDPRELVAFLIILRTLMKEEGVNSTRSFDRIRNILGMSQDFNYMEKYVTELEKKSLNPETRNHLARLFEAIILRKKARFTYQPASSAILEIEVEPYRLIHHNDSYYLVGLPKGKTELRTYKLSRMAHLEVLRESFNMPDSVDVQPFSIPWDFGEGTPVRVRLRLSEKAVLFRIGERKYHPTQELIQFPDGTAELTVEVKRPEKMLSWIFSFGQDAEVLEPEHLREMVIRELDAMKSMYSESFHEETI